MSSDVRQPTVIRKRIHCKITGSVDDFIKLGSDAATWSVQNGKSGEVFGLNDLCDNTLDHELAASTLSNALLHRVTVLEHKNEYPLNLGITINGIPSDEVTSSGHRYALTALANSHNSTPITIFSSETDSTDGIEWRSKYPQYNSQNLETQGVLQVNQQPYVFVNQNHPVIELLRQNKNLLNADIDAQPRIDGEWLKIARQVMNTCCQTLRSKVLSKVASRDLNQLSLQIHRLDQNDWANTHMDNEILRAVPQEIALAAREDASKRVMLAKAVEGVLDTPYSYSCRLELEYEVPI